VLQAESAFTVLGERIATNGRHRKIAGCVVDGRVCYIPAIVAFDFPVSAPGVTLISWLQRGGTEVCFSLQHRGIAAHSGDVRLGDATGVVVRIHDSAARRLERPYERTTSEGNHGHEMDTGDAVGAGLGAWRVHAA
jgi:regulator of RNase E activity RraA